MYALKVVITTLDVILMLLMLGFCRGEKSKETVIGFTGIITLMVANVVCIWM